MDYIRMHRTLILEQSNEQKCTEKQEMMLWLKTWIETVLIFNVYMPAGKLFTISQENKQDFI